MNFSCQFGEEIAVDGVSALRKFEDPNRIVIAFTSLLTPSDTGMLFRGNGWLILSDTKTSSSSAAASPSPSHHASLLQVCYTINVEERGPTTSEHNAYLQSVVLGAESEKMRTHLLHLQDMLLHELPAVHSPMSPNRALFASAMD